MLYTDNFNFKKLELTDSPADITELNSNWDSIDTELKGRRLSTVSVPNADLNTLLADKTYSCAGTIKNAPILNTFCIVKCYDTGAEINGVIVQICHVPQTDFTVRTFIRSVSNGVVFGAWKEITTGAELDLLQIRIDDNTFRCDVLANVLSKDLTTLFIEDFFNTDDVDKSVADGQYVVDNYYIQSKKMIDKYEVGTKTIYSVAKTVTSGNNRAWCMVDWENIENGSIAVEISRNNGVNYTPLNINGNITSISTQPTGVGMIVKVTMTGKLRFKNIAWGLK